MGKAALYLYTIRYMKASQVFNRILIRLGKGCSLGVQPSNDYSKVQSVKSNEYLDFDPVCLARFPVKQLMENTISILHSTKAMDWKKTWDFEDKSALWNFNLHYFEYLFPLVKAWKDTGEICYLKKTEEMILGWIEANPEGRKPAWASYTTALRIVAWITYFGYVQSELSTEFREKLLSSLHRQYIYLSGHLEKDILGNHYFEDLKSLVIAALFFNDEKVLKKALADFKKECEEEIIEDGMHFEYSPMYHKIIFEGMLRVATALRSCGKRDETIESYLQPMLNVAYSFENGLDRVPLFNDGGDNVSKSLDALLLAADYGFMLKPQTLSILDKSGFCFFEKVVDNNRWRLVVDAGNPGPLYNSGHAHCDALSYELFCNGIPVIVNCGTFDYQCKERNFFRSTEAHNTVMINRREQSQCWGNFRMAKRSSARILEYNEKGITIEMVDAQKARCIRSMVFTDSDLVIEDYAPGEELEVFVHTNDSVRIDSDATCVEETQPYAPEYGKKTDIVCYRYKAKERIVHKIKLCNMLQNMEERI